LWTDSVTWQVKGVAKALNTNLEEGVEDSPEELQKRKDAYGDNTYPRKRPKGFLTFLWEACQDTTLIILMVAAVVSLAVSMPTDGPKNGWYDGTAIGVAVVLVICVTGKVLVFSFNDPTGSFQLKLGSVSCWSILHLFRPYLAKPCNWEYILWESESFKRIWLGSKRDFFIY
jgi:magnesium-transporting ATPase (P-type)